MTQSELLIGKTYTNGKKRESIREILKFLDCPNGWIEDLCVRYLVIKGARSEVGKEFTITKRSFAKWAHHEVVN